ncbi:hypothetical protein EDD28_1297 [Salana multivorans]|uniref:Uncharacterized protein n=1 Tax=Salana multivorans TaxID=120377 RepID=A0A3N2DA74_9MICO|nr:hypothetical protein [Salana multivorans]ROR96706.1 hypothetical protein EDD28_1297 [Salana multivorans]
MEKHHGREHARQERHEQAERSGEHEGRDRADEENVRARVEELEATLTAQRDAGDREGAERTLGEITHLRERLRRDRNELTDEA